MKRRILGAGLKQELELKLHFRHFPELQAKLSVHEFELEGELELDLELERKLELGSKLEPELDLAPEPELHFRHAPELQAELSFRCASSQVYGSSIRRKDRAEVGAEATEGV